MRIAFVVSTNQGLICLSTWQLELARYLNGLLAYDAKAMNLPRAGDCSATGQRYQWFGMVVARTAPGDDALIRFDRRARGRPSLFGAGPSTGWQPYSESTAPIRPDPRNRFANGDSHMGKKSGKRPEQVLTFFKPAIRGVGFAALWHTGRTTKSASTWHRSGIQLVADELYGGAAAAGMQRQALHACRLAFTHPVTQSPCLFTPSCQWI